MWYYIKLGATVEEARQAARDANADEFIEALPDKYDTQVRMLAIDRFDTVQC